MTPSPFDHQLVQSMLFYPRSAEPGSARPNVIDGTIPIEDGVRLGYRLYKYDPAAPVIVYFHGNGEIAPDYDDQAPEYHRIGASLIVIDYRGYGWSSGRPTTTSLLPDAEIAAAALPQILTAAGLGDPPLFLMGRSLGSLPAIHLAHLQPDRWRGLIIESGIADILPLLARFGLPIATMMNLEDPVGNRRKIAATPLPLLVIHGENDQIVPAADGQALYDESPAEYKRILRVRGAGHNDLLFVAFDSYFESVYTFLRDVS
jgi:hypothetical protein